MTKTTSGTFKNTHWNEQPHSQVEGGPALTVAEKESSIDGGVKGTGVLRYSTVRLADGSVVFTGHMRITGRIGDREGSFVVEDSGSGTAEKAGGTWKVVAESGTGALAGIRGDGAWTWEGGETTAYTLSYDL